MKQVDTVTGSVVCAHCGDPCADGAIVVDERSFCCTGCSSVYQILQSHDMCDYYGIDPKAGISQRTPRYGADAYAVLDDPSVMHRFVEFQRDTTIHLRFEIPSMHCASCVWLLDRLDRFDEGVQSSEVDFMRKTVRVVIDTRRTAASNVAMLLSQLGYEPLLHGEGTEAATDHERRLRLRTMYIRIGIAAFAAGNLMMIAAAQYLAVGETIDPTLKRVFDLLSIALAVPVLLYSAAPWYRSAWGALRHRTVNLDVPVALGISTLFVRSVIDIAMGSGEGYLDSFAGLVLFLLVGRLFQQKAFDAVSFDRTYRSFFPLSVRVERQGAEHVVPIDQVSPGDVLHVRNGEVIPCDAVLTSAAAFVDYAFVTGESVPVECSDGALVHAGGRVVGRGARLTAVKNVSQSYLASLWERNGTKTDRRSYMDISDRFGKWFTAFAIAVAVLGLIAWLPDWQMALTVFTAVLIIACPCALTIAAPVTLGTAIGRLSLRGIYVRNAVTLMDLTRITAVVFDKTGTLTEAVHRVQVDHRDLSDEAWQAVQAVAAHSTHPISRSIAGSSVSSNVSDVEEVVGQGIRGTSHGYQVAIGRREFVAPGDNQESDTTVAAWLAVNGQLAGAVRITPTLRSGVRAMIATLRKRLAVVLSTGDSDRDRDVFVDAFGPGQMHFEQRPHEKVATITSAKGTNGRVLMVGDGLNDAAAMAAADASVAVTDGTSTLVPACDVVMPAVELQHLPRLLDYAGIMTSVIKASFIFTVFYNAVGLGLALAGLLSPLITAILMPVSSLIVIGISVFGARFYARRSAWE